MNILIQNIPLTISVALNIVFIFVIASNNNKIEKLEKKLKHYEGIINDNIEKATSELMAGLKELFGTPCAVEKKPAKKTVKKTVAKKKSVSKAKKPAKDF